MAEIVRKIGKITKYETKSYVGRAPDPRSRPLGPVVRAPHAEDTLAPKAGENPGPTPSVVSERGE